MSKLKKYKFHILFLVIGFIIGWRIMPHTKIISETIVNEPEVVYKVEMED